MAHDEQEDDPTVWHVRELEHGWWHKLEPYTQRWFFVVRARVALSRAHTNTRDVARMCQI